MNPAHRLRKIRTAVLSTLVSIAIAIPIVRQHRPGTPAGANIRSVDTRDAMVALLEEQQRADPELPSTAPEEVPERIERPRWTLNPELVPTFFPTIKQVDMQPAEGSWYARIPNHRQRRLWSEHPEGAFATVTNAQGLRDDADVRSQRPAVRLLFTGDSHIDGVLDNRDSLPNRIETWLADALGQEEVEVLNAAVGGFTLHNYVGTFERLAFLQPHAFVAVVYGGNDFQAAVVLHRYFESLGKFEFERFSPGARNDAWEASGTIRAQESGQVKYFLDNPGDEALAIEAALTALRELQRQCREQGVPLLVAYLPPPMTGQPQFWEEARALTREALDCSDEALAVSDRIADGMLDGLRESGVPTVDLRPRIRGSLDLLYWREDCHLNIKGHHACADELAEPVAALLPLTPQQRARLEQGRDLTASMNRAEQQRLGIHEGQLLASLYPPSRMEAPWMWEPSVIRVVPLLGRNVLFLPATRAPLAVEVAAAVPDDAVSGVRVVFRSDGAFTTRAHIGARVSASVESAATDRQAQSVYLPLPGARGTASTVTVRVELIEATAPVLLEAVHLVR